MPSFPFIADRGWAQCIAANGIRLENGYSCNIGAGAPPAIPPVKEGSVYWDVEAQSLWVKGPEAWQQLPSSNEQVAKLTKEFVALYSSLSNAYDLIADSKLQAVKAKLYAEAAIVISSCSFAGAVLTFFLTR